MKRRSSQVLALGFGATLAALLAMGDRQREVHRHEFALGQLRSLASVQTEIAELVLASRIGIEPSYDRVVAKREEFTRGLQAVAPMVERDAARSAPVLASRLRTIQEADLDFGDRLERFKREQAVLRNSIRYLPEAAFIAAREARSAGDAQGAVAIQTFAVQVLDCVLNESVACSVRGRAGLPAAANDPGSADASFARHAEAVLVGADSVDALVKELHDHALRSAITALVVHYATRIEGMHAELRAIQWGFASLSIGLIVAVAWTLLALGRSRNELERVNAGLEAQVAERSAQLAQAQKLEAVGQLASGIAHEINTPAQFVSDNLHFLADSFEELRTLASDYRDLMTARDADRAAWVAEQRSRFDESNLQFLLKEIPEALEQSSTGIARVTEIVGAMKEFSHPGSSGFELADLNRSIESTVTVARNEWRYVAELSLELDRTLPLVPCLSGELNQAVLNMVVNSAHAISERHPSGDLGHIWITTRKRDGHAEIEIRDDGAGIPEALRERIFEPFFTTKQVGKGTGQGLAIARSIVIDKHRGRLEIESEVGVGTTLRIQLPLDLPHAEAAVA